MESELLQLLSFLWFKNQGKLNPEELSFLPRPGRSRESQSDPTLWFWTCILIPKHYFYPIMRAAFPLIKILLQM